MPTHPALPRNVVLHGDCLELLKTLPSSSVDAVVSDPPAGIAFMGTKWDSFVGRGKNGERDAFIAFMTDVFTEVYRVLKPGGHGIVWALPRTSHWTAMGLEDAGFEIRDRIAHIFGQGFPKSLNVSKAIDRVGGALPEEQAELLQQKRLAQGMTREDLAAKVGCTASSIRDWEEGRARKKGGEVEYVIPSAAYRKKLAELLGYSEDERRIVGLTKPRKGDGTSVGLGHSGQLTTTARSELAQQHAGKGTALKPAVEDWWLIRKPLEGSVADTVLKHGTGALNIDASRVGTDVVWKPEWQATSGKGGQVGTPTEEGAERQGFGVKQTAGRWPSNLVLSHSPGCRRVGETTVPGPTLNRYEDGVRPFGGAEGEAYSSTPTGPEQLGLYQCEDGCPVDALNQQSGVDKGGDGPRSLSRTQPQRSFKGDFPGDPGYAGVDYGDGGGASRYFQTFECEDGCPIAALDEQSGSRPSTLSGRADPSQAHAHPSNAATDSWFSGGQAQQSQVYADEGGASRYFQAFEPEVGVPFLYNGKITTRERNEGLEDLKARAQHSMDDAAISTQSNRRCQLCGYVKFGQPHCECPEPLWEETQGSRAANFHPCLHPEALVLTERGYRPIRTIERGDLVYAADGTFRPVQVVSSHAYMSPDLIHIRVRGMSETTLASDNHPFLIWRPRRKGAAIVGGEVMWLRADAIKKGDYTMTPVLRPVGWVQDPIELEFGFVLGLYMAEGVLQSAGSGSNVYPSFTLHEDETDLIDRLRRYVGPEKIRVYPKPDSKAVQVVAFDPALGRACEQYGGRGSSTKRLDPTVWSWTTAQQIAVWEGWLAGDGGRVRGHLQAKTVSPDLAAQMALLGEAAGYRARVYKSPAPQGKSIGDRLFKTTQPVYQLDFTKSSRPAGPVRVEHDGTTFTLRPVTAVVRVPYEGDVVNLTVDGNPTFMTAVGMSHNTVKPVKLMRYLCKLVTPKGGIILDPFAGSGSTLVAAAEEGYAFVGIERDPDYIHITRARAERAVQKAADVQAQRDGFALMQSFGIEDD